MRRPLTRCISGNIAGLNVPSLLNDVSVVVAVLLRFGMLVLQMHVRMWLLRMGELVLWNLVSLVVVLLGWYFGGRSTCGFPVRWGPWAWIILAGIRER